MNVCLRLSLFVLALICVIPLANANEPLLILYQDRVPYYETQADGTISGLVGKPTYDAFKKAGIETVWVPVPPNRQIETIRQHHKPACSPGWFKTREREGFAKYSDVVYQDGAQILITTTRMAHLFVHSNLDQLFQDDRFVLGMKLGYSYGENIDKKIARYHPSVMRTSQPVSGMVKMMLKNRFDYFISTPEEYQALLKQSPVLSGRLRTIETEDFTAGQKRYLICSMLVPDDIVTRFSQALTAK